MRRPRYLPTATLVLGILVSTASVSAQGFGSRTAEQLVQDAETAIEAQHYRDAFELFSEAAGMLRSDASLCVRAASAASMAGRSADAESWLERALHVNPRYTPAALLLGQVLYRQGRVSEAVAVYESAAGYAPDDPQLAERLEQWRTEAVLQSAFFEARGAHFAVLFEDPADDLLARDIVDLLEEAYWRVGYELSAYPAGTITVVLYTPQQFNEVTHSPTWADGAYDGRIKLPAAGRYERGEQLRRVLEHELVHALVSSVAGPLVPTWLHEGLAIMLESGGLEWADGVLARTPERLSGALLSGAFSGLTSEQASLAYAQSAATVRRMVEQRGMPAVVALMQALGQGAPLESAFQDTLLIRPDEFELLALR
jgi:tetratricopeptide (TPR) repeat protein